VLQQVAGEHDPATMPAYLKPRFIILLVTATVVLPLCLLRTMGALRYSSLIAVACTTYLSVAVTANYFSFCASDAVVTAKGGANETVQCFWEPRAEGQTPIVLARWGPDRMLAAIPIVVYAYTCHPNVLPVFLELQKPTRRRMNKVVARAIGASFLMYAAIGAFGYLTFKDQLESSEGNFLKNDYHHNASMLLGSIGMSFSVVLALPLFVNAFRGNVYRLVKGERADAKDAPAAWHYGMSVGLVVAAVLPAIAVTDVSKVFQVLGATTNPVICFVLPSMFIQKAPAGMYVYEKVLSVVVAVVIGVLSIISLVQNVKSWGGDKHDDVLGDKLWLY
jgi:amino acid permease